MKDAFLNVCPWLCNLFIVLSGNNDSACVVFDCREKFLLLRHQMPLLMKCAAEYYKMVWLEVISHDMTQLFTVLARFVY